MGMIIIETNGSFGVRRVEFAAQQHGHSHCVREAIKFLVDRLMGQAVNDDHALHDENKSPDAGFCKKIE